MTWRKTRRSGEVKRGPVVLIGAVMGACAWACWLAPSFVGRSNPISSLIRGGDCGKPRWSSPDCRRHRLARLAAASEEPEKKEEDDQIAGEEDVEEESMDSDKSFDEEVEAEEMEEEDEEEEEELEGEEEESEKDRLQAILKDFRGRLVAARRNGQWLEVLETWRRMKLSPDVEPDVVSYNAVLRAMLETNQSYRLLKTVKEMRENNVTITDEGYASIIYTLGMGSANYSKLAFQYFEKAKAQVPRGQQMGNEVYLAALYACFAQGAWKRALMIHREARSLPTPITKGILKYPLVACLENGQIDAASELLQEVEDAGDYELRFLHYGLVISSCQRVGRWYDVVALSDRMQEKGVLPDAVTSKGVLRAMSELGVCEKAAEYLDMMRREGLQPDSGDFSTVMKLCSEVGEYERVVTVFEDAKIYFTQEDTSLDFGRSAMDIIVASLNALLELNRYEDAEDLCHQALSSGWLQVWQKQRLRLAAPMLLFEGLPLKVAKLVSRVALQDLADARTPGIRLGLFSGLDIRIVITRRLVEEDTNDEREAETFTQGILDSLEEFLGPDAGVEAAFDEYSSTRFIQVPVDVVKGLTVSSAA